jgi:hypothetical protein
MPEAQARPELLNTWKEIARYLGRAVRTVQRWEAFGLPVRRVTPGPRASVIADAREIDVWLRTAGLPREVRASTSYRPILIESLAQYRELRAEMRSSRAALLLRYQALRSNIDRLKENWAR